MNPEPADLSILPVPPMPEDSPSDNTTHLIDTDIDFIHLINRWQPMGFRVVVDLPYVGDDSTPIVAIRVNPLIEPVSLWMCSTAAAVSTEMTRTPIYPLPIQVDTLNTSVTVTRYDHPPALSIAAAAHRFWRGSIMYRFRSVTNFVTSAYIFACLARGLIATEVPRFDGTGASVPSNDLRNQVRWIPGVDVSPRRWMSNAYVMSDASMNRHLEVVAPFEYPVQFFDNYRHAFELNKRSNLNNEIVETNCPDNFILLYNRGPITSPTPGAQLIFELEYAPGPDFELSTEFAFSRYNLEVNLRNNASNDLILPNWPNYNLPFTYPAP